ncbi:MAG: FtsX-like permease family protein [Ilumatobacteraceae bacterium]
MTILDERPASATTEPLGGSPERAWMSPSSWRFAARLARREVRRRPGRTALVALLVFVPVLAMTMGAILVRSDTPAAAFARSHGTADVALTQYLEPDPVLARQDVDLSADRNLLPAGSTTTQITTTYTNVTPVEGTALFVTATAFDPASPITQGIIEVDHGRLPTTENEVLLASAVADELSVGVGDELRLERPDMTVRVVGIGRTADDHKRPLMLFGQLDIETLRGAAITTLIDLPDGVDANRFLQDASAASSLTPDQLNRMSVQLRDSGWYSSGSQGALGPDTQTLAWGWVIGVLLLAALGVIIAAAFATSARRQLATVGQLAANGASPGLIRRTLALQGTWSGIIGSLAGITLGIGVFVLTAPLIERIAGRSWTNTTIRPSDMAILFLTGSAAATIAALVPSRSLANTSVLQALAGRRPIRPVKARTVTIGLACFAAGIFLLTVAAAAGRDGTNGDENLFAMVAVLGGVGVLVGMCLASPIAVSATTAVAARLGASWRLSGRSLHRTRWRSAAVVTAIGVACAFAVAAGTLAGAIDDTSSGERTDMPRNEVRIQNTSGGSAATLDPSVLQAVRGITGPSEESLVYGIDLEPPSNEELDARYIANEQEQMYIPILTAPEVTVADDRLLDIMGLSDTDRAALDELGALTMWGFYVDDGQPIGPPPTQPVVIVGAGQAIDLEVGSFRDPYETRDGVGGLLMTADAARELGLGVIPVGIRFTTDDDLTAAQRRDLDSIRFADQPNTDSWIVGDETAAYPDSGQQGFWIDYQYVSYTPSKALVQAAIAAAALVLVLIVIAIGLSLAAAESRDERNTLIAVGASPATLRRRSATTATLLAVTGGVIGVPTGLLPVWAVQRTIDTPTEVPWWSIAAVVVVIPALVGIVALIGSGLSQRLRPPRIMQDHTD